MLLKVVREGVYSSFTRLSRLLPLWKEAEAITVIPPLLWKPVTPPVNHSHLPASFAAQFIRGKCIPARRIFLLKDVCISPDAVVFKNLKIFTPSLTWLRDLNTHRKGKLLLKQWRRKAGQVAGTETVALVFDQWSADNYYHWMVESLPRLLLVQEKYPDCLLLIPEPAPGYVRRTVSLLGFNRVLPLRRKTEEIVKVANLVLPELVYYYEEQEYINLFGTVRSEVADSGSFTEAGNGLQHQELIAVVRQKLLKGFAGTPVHAGRRIYVSRSRQKTRRLSNEQSIQPLLEKYGFETVYFEGMTFDEQVSLMLETEILLGVHGANMVNILFLQAGARVVEMMNKDHLNDAYYLMSSSIGLPYFSVPCAMADKSIHLTDDTVKLNDADLEVNVTQLEETLQLSVNH